MSVMLLEPGLTALLESPAGRVGQVVAEKAAAVAEFARGNIQEKFHTRTGALFQSIGVFPTENQRPGTDYEVGTGGGQNERGVPCGLYGRVLELGGEPHAIYRVAAPFLWSDANNPTPLFEPAVSVHSPGPPAKPWLVPACRQAGFVDV
jgi:hypothetical protein